MVQILQDRSAYEPLGGLFEVLGQGLTGYTQGKQDKYKRELEERKAYVPQKYWEDLEFDPKTAALLSRLPPRQAAEYAKLLGQGGYGQPQQGSTQGFTPQGVPGPLAALEALQPRVGNQQQGMGMQGNPLMNALLNPQPNYGNLQPGMNLNPGMDFGGMGRQQQQAPMQQGPIQSPQQTPEPAPVKRRGFMEALGNSQPERHNAAIDKENKTFEDAAFKDYTSAARMEEKLDRLEQTFNTGKVAEKSFLPENEIARAFYNQMGWASPETLTFDALGKEIANEIAGQGKGATTNMKVRRAELIKPNVNDPREVQQKKIAGMREAIREAKLSTKVADRIKERNPGRSVRELGAKVRKEIERIEKLEDEVPFGTPPGEPYMDSITGETLVWDGNHLNYE